MSGSEQKQISRRVCLVVDDEAFVRTYIRAVLEGEGFRAIEAENGLQALDLIRGLATGVDLLISDIRMPKMDGVSLACSVRAEFPGTPVILVSGDSEVNIAEFPELNMVEFIQKPFLPAKLLDAAKRNMRPVTKNASSELRKEASSAEAPKSDIPRSA